ncbi:MAG: hypothetical protein GXP22_07820 [Gammaproteobacteria bacterium]|nr:hypothetical protein [Gammaproteobacteria bacterium]
MYKDVFYFVHYSLMMGLMIFTVDLSAYVEVPMLKTKDYYSHSNYWPSIGCFESRGEAVSAYKAYDLSLSGLCDISDDGSTGFSASSRSATIFNFIDFSYSCKAWESLGISFDDVWGKLRIQEIAYDASYFTYMGNRPDDPGCDIVKSSVVHNFIKVNWSYCPPGSEWGMDEARRSLCKQQYYLLAKDVLEPAGESLGRCPKGSGFIGNPVNPASGNKFHQETIRMSYGPAAMSFNLFYNKMDDVDRGLGQGWRHSFSSSIALASSTEQERFPAKNDLKFDTAEAACINGWGQIKAGYSLAWATESSAVLLDNGRCQIRYGISDKVWGDFPVRMATTGLPYEVAAAGARVVLTRADGKQVLFHQQPDDEWVNDTGFIGKLMAQVSAAGNLMGWVLYRENDSREYYDYFGRLILIVDIKGNYQSLNYSANGQLLRVENNLGFFMVISYDQQGRPSMIQDKTQRAWSFEYDAINNLQFLRYPDATVKQYHYENNLFPSALTGITDQRDLRFSWYDYDSVGRVISSYHAQNADRIDIEYRADGVRYVTNARGYRSEYGTERRNGIFVVNHIEGQACQSCDGTVRDYDYDVSNNIVGIRDGRGVLLTRGGFDAHGNPGYQIEAAGSAQSRRTDYQYDRRFFQRLGMRSEPSVNQLDSSARRVLQYDYDDYANLLAWGVTGFTPQGEIVQRHYSAQYQGPLHQVSQRDGARTDVTDIRYFEYYPDDEIVGNNRARLRRVIAEDGMLLRDDIQYTASGQLLSEKRTNGLALEYRYSLLSDRLELLIERTAGNMRKTRWRYLATGEVKSIEFSYESPSQSSIYFSYDDARRLTGLSNDAGERIDYVLDEEGNRTVLTVNDSDGRQWKQLSYAYNRVNQVLQRTQENEIKSFSYDSLGLLEKTIDGNNLERVYRYDLLQQLVGETILAGDDRLIPYAEREYRYDVGSRRTLSTPERQVMTTRVYDDLGNLLEDKSADKGDHLWRYDEAGNRVLGMDVQGDEITYLYDVRNRLIQVDAMGISDDIVYIYDECENGQGRLCRIVQAGNSLFYQYDSLGRVSQYQGLYYYYDDADRLIKSVYPSGLIVFYSYDMSGQVSSVSVDRGAGQEVLAYSIQHIPYGGIRQVKYGNGLLMQRDYDRAYRVVSEQLSSVYNKQYDRYDANGHILVQSNLLQGTIDEYQYDGLSRLLSEQTRLGQRVYGYDQSGNRLTVKDGLGESVQSLAYANDSNHLLFIDGIAVSYDAYGNQLNNTQYDFLYNAHAQLREVYQAGGLIVEYAYNAMGQRVKKTLSGADGYQYFYDPAGHLVAEADLWGRVLREYIYVGDRLLAQYQVDSDANGLDDVNEQTVMVFADNDHDSVSNNDEWFVIGSDVNQEDSDQDGFNDGLEIDQGTNPLAGNQYPGDGDMNGNASIDVGDYLLLVDIIMSDRVPDKSDYLHADINLDGVIDLQDMLLLTTRLLDLSRVKDWVSSSLSWLMPDSVHAATNSYGSIYYIHTNHIGAPLVLTDEQANVVSRIDYWAFGEAIVNDFSVNAPICNLRYPGQYFDAETALHYNHYRYYEPESGRYLTADPRGQSLDFSDPMRQVATMTGIAIPASKGIAYLNHSYNYVDNNPLMHIDPTGEVDPVTGVILLWSFLYVSEAGDLISDDNGNVWDGYTSQDGGKCSLPWPLGPIGDSCFSGRCQKHDVCYDNNSCNLSSWISSGLGGSKSCNKCNSGFFQ